MNKVEKLPEFKVDIQQLQNSICNVKTSEELQRCHRDFQRVVAVGFSLYTQHEVNNCDETIKKIEELEKREICKEVPVCGDFLKACKKFFESSKKVEITKGRIIQKVLKPFDDDFSEEKLQKSSVKFEDLKTESEMKPKEEKYKKFQETAKKSISSFKNYNEIKLGIVITVGVFVCAVFFIFFLAATILLL